MKRFGWTFGFLTAMLATYAIAGTLLVQVTGGAVQSSQAVTPPDAPAGSVIMFASTTPPSGWLLLDGSTYDQSVYPDLFAVLGTTTLPDMRGQFVRGWSTSTAQDPGGPRGPLSTQGDLLGSHQHTMTYLSWDSGLNHGYNDSTVGIAVGCCGITPIQSTRFIASAGGAETRPKNMAWAFIIKATPAAAAPAALSVAMVQDMIDQSLMDASASPTPEPSGSGAPVTEPPSPTPSGDTSGSASGSAAPSPTP